MRLSPSALVLMSMLAWQTHGHAQGVVGPSGYFSPTVGVKNDAAFGPALVGPRTAQLPYLILMFSPPSPAILATASIGAVVTTINVSWSNLAPFTGTLSFGAPYSNDSGDFAISAGHVVVNSSLLAAVGTTQNVTIVATQ